jgi:hypothetical protein
VAIPIDTDLLVYVGHGVGSPEVERILGEEDCAISVLTVSELLHGVHRATGARRTRRSAFVARRGLTPALVEAKGELRVITVPSGTPRSRRRPFARSRRGLKPGEPADVSALIALAWDSHLHHVWNAFRRSRRACTAPGAEADAAAVEAMLRS